MKFEVNEIAQIAVVGNPQCPLRPGDEVTVIAVGPFPRCVITPGANVFEAQVFDYDIRDAHGRVWVCLESELRKRRLPQQAGSWDAIAEYTKWHPRRIEERV